MECNVSATKWNATKRNSSKRVVSFASNKKCDFVRRAKILCPRRRHPQAFIAG
jgi:hypothetical protein